MMGDHHHFGRSSLLLASHDRAHREHIHQHHLLHRGDSGIVGATVTEVVATVSVIQQVTVDSNGVTIGLHTFTADSTGGTSYPPTTTENATPSTTPASPGTSSLGVTASSTAGTGPGDQLANNAASSSQSLLSIQNIETATAATISSIPTTFASILANSTSLIPVSSATSLTPSFSNSSSSSSTLSDSSSSSVFINLLSSSTISDESSTLSGSSTSVIFSSVTGSSPTATSTDGIGGGGSGTGTGSGDASTSTAAAGSGDGSNSSPSTSTVVGGVVGGVAGAAILIFLLMFLIRWKRRNSSMLALGSGEGEGAAGTSRGVPPSQPPGGGMAERSSFGGFVVPAALASLTGYKRSSQRTADRNTISSTAGSERGFYRVSGRKLPSVLQSGGDGYGGGIMESNTLSGSSFYRDSQGFYGGSGGPSSPPLGLSMPRDSGVPIMREGPARTPVTEQGPFANPPVSLTPPPRRPDVVGRSHPSFDGSQRSRFTEEV
ncbi:hypothetical protein IFR05_004281 [Cadophora sp. M221]|nr:hypothetical protein IFR05_004281 [Cadophora sp. M221]